MNRTAESHSPDQRAEPASETQVGPPEGTAATGVGRCLVSWAGHLARRGALPSLHHAPILCVLCLIPLIGACQQQPRGEEVLETVELEEGPTAAFGFDDDEKAAARDEGVSGAVPADFPQGLAMPAEAVVEGWGSVDERTRWLEFKVPSSWDANAWQSANWNQWQRVDDATWRRGSVTVTTSWPTTEDGVRRLRIVYPAQTL